MLPSEAIELYFWEFMAFFFPAIAPHLDEHRDPEFLDTELQQIVRDADERPRWRPHSYETSVLGCEVRFNVPVVKLLDYAQDWSTLDANRNPFATVVMAHLKARETSGDALSRKDWKLRLTRRLYEQGYGREDILELYRFIDWLIELPEPLEMMFQAELAAYEGDGTMRYVSTLERQGIQKGREEGRQQGERSLVLRLLNRRLGELPESVIQPINALSIESLEALGEALLDFQSMDDLEQWFTAYHQQQSQPE